MSHTQQILVGVCGSIAAYKAVGVVRQLQAAGGSVQVVMTPSALQFVGKATFEGLTRKPAYSEMTEAPDELHVTLAAAARDFVVVAATADFLSRLAAGRASDLLTATALCYGPHLWVAPAMHPNMWRHPAVQRNVERLRQDGTQFLGPVEGRVASGEFGVGRMMEPEEIAAALCVPLDLVGRRVIVSAGPTVEDLDPVRFISNRSTGKMGYAVAEQAQRRGAQVELVTGPVHVSPPSGVRVHAIRSALELLNTLESLTQDPCDAVIMAAAVGDYRARTPSPHKLKRSQGVVLDLVENPDVIATLGQRRSGASPVLVAFALETGDDDSILRHARGKLEQKRVDLVVANRADEALAQDTNRVHLVTSNGHTSYPEQSKTQVANHILDFVAQRTARS